VAADIDAEVASFINKAFEVAKKVISSRKKVLDAIAKALIEKEMLEQDEFQALIKSFNVKPLAI
jgi:cell division protease FtsH